MKQVLIMQQKGLRRIQRTTYLRIELIDLLDGRLNVTRVNRSANSNALTHRCAIHARLNIGLSSKFLSCLRVAIGDEVVHD